MLRNLTPRQNIFAREKYRKNFVAVLSFRPFLAKNGQKSPFLTIFRQKSIRNSEPKSDHFWSKIDQILIEKSIKKMSLQSRYDQIWSILIKNDHLPSLQGHFLIRFDQKIDQFLIKTCPCKEGFDQFWSNLITSFLRHKKCLKNEGVKNDHFWPLLTRARLVGLKIGHFWGILRPSQKWPILRGTSLALVKRGKKWSFLRHFKNGHFLGAKMCHFWDTFLRGCAAKKWRCTSAAPKFSKIKNFWKF